MSIGPSSNSESPRILIVRLSAIGDVIHGMPLACSLRERFPKGFLAWVVQQRGAELLAGHEALDELIVLPRGFLKSPGALWRVRRRLRALNFDYAIDAQGLTKSALVGYLAGARRRIGYGNPWGRELSRWLNTELVDTVAEHAVDRHLELLRPLGIESPAVEFNVPEHTSDRRAAETIIAESGVQDGFGIINVGAGWPSKLWPPGRYAAVAAYLGNRHSLPTLVISGNRRERERAEAVSAGSLRFAKVAPPISLAQLAALARRARLFLGSDTGPLHLAAAVGTPCVGLYGPWPAQGHGPYGKQHLVLQKMCFKGSTRQRRNAPPIYMEAITVKMVCRACDRLLNRRSWNVA